MTLFSSARDSYFSYPDNADVNKDSSNHAAHLVDHLLKKIEEINVGKKKLNLAPIGAQEMHMFVRLFVCASDSNLSNFLGSDSACLRLVAWS